VLVQQILLSCPMMLNGKCCKALRPSVPWPAVSTIHDDNAKRPGIVGVETPFQHKDYGTELT
jgi:hypothetical protein